MRFSPQFPVLERDAGHSRRRILDGDEIELISQLTDLDPLGQRATVEVRAHLWRGTRIVNALTA